MAVRRFRKGRFLICRPPEAGNLAPVRVTMMLCDAAQVSDGKLYVLGRRVVA